MTRQAFITRLRAGLRGLPAAVVDEIAADYEAHFTEAAAAGRSEADVAAALGDPGRLARELRAEATLKRWETDRNPSSATAALVAILGLGAIDVLILVPVLTSVGGTLITFAITAMFGFIGGAVTMIAGPIFIHGAPISAIVVGGLGIMAASICVGSVVALAAIACVHALIWCGRLHLRLLRPVLQSSEIAA
jgi:uncharacterized membrane protein